jgi:dTDP-4-amino-4,6-dideoxy-D-glucose ammonia-lyase
MENINPAAKGYVENNEEENYVDNEFIKNNKECWEIIKLFSDSPFLTQEEVSKKLNFTKEQLIQFNKKILNSEWAQNYIINSGAGKKYWKNTVIPSTINGKTDAVLNKRYSYPDRIGFCPGLSCQFFCSFCGRNYSAAYEREFGDKGYDMFKQIIDQTPQDLKDNPYHITGGLEPLTFPRIGDLISYGAKKGFPMEMKTNGFSLTPEFLIKQPGVLDLSVLRISLYGVNQESTLEVTKNPKGFERVKNNIIDFLKLKTKIKVGLNYVILHNNLDDVLLLLDYIEDVNSKANNQVDFLTLREDFSPEAKILSVDERKKLLDIFNEIDIRLKSPNLNKLHIDYGYALESIKQNRESLEPLKRIDYTEMRPKMFPQLSVMIDPKGDVYGYHEATFLDKEGSERYCIGQVSESKSLEQVVKEFVEKTEGVEPLPMDISYLDAYDHIITILLNQADEDKKFGIPWSNGPIKIRIN